MNEYYVETIARQRLQESARHAERARLTQGFRKVRAGRRFPRVRWAVPSVQTTARA